MITLRDKARTKLEGPITGHKIGVTETGYEVFLFVPGKMYLLEYSNIQDVLDDVMHTLTRIVKDEK